MMARRLLGALLAAWSGVAAAGDMEFSYTPNPAPGEQPAFLVTPQLPLDALYIEVTAGDEVYTFEREGLAAGKQLRFAWTRDPSVTSATVLVRGLYAAGHEEMIEIPIQYSYGAPLSVDLSQARADLKARTLTVRVTQPVQRAEVVAYGARKAVLDRSEVRLDGAGPGEIVIPWVGKPEEVVLLEVTLHGEGAWAGFTFSPWVLNVPHDDVLFASNDATIPGAEEWKLEATLRQLQEVLDKYGSIVPVKVYIAGCTDTVGDTAHNRDLSLRRARAIAAWLRSHGYSQPLYYHGFGESLLAVQTGDGVDEAANRRALYVVSANPPPPSSGIPTVSWQEL